MHDSINKETIRRCQEAFNMSDMSDLKRCYTRKFQEAFAAIQKQYERGQNYERNKRKYGGAF